MSRRRAGRESGFIITLELVLIFTILGIGLFVGIIAIRNALFVHALKKASEKVWIFDSSTPPKVLGQARDFDEHETPRLFYIDRGVAWNGMTRNYRVLIGVRHDRFTSRQKIFYTGPACTGSPCIEASGADPGDTTSAGQPRGAEIGGVGALYPLQGGPSYGVGMGTGTHLPGDLYRQATLSCPAGSIRSAWVSQAVTSTEPCEEFLFPADEVPASCPVALFGAACTANPGCVDQGTYCGCPDGWRRMPVAGSDTCCPAGSTLIGGVCTSGADLVAAELVVDGGGAPVFSALRAPFRTNLPRDASSFLLLRPGGAEGAPGIPTGIPYDPSQPIDFSSPSDGEEGPTG